MASPAKTKLTRVGLILSGCGFQDGAEIQEAVVSMLALEEAGAVVLPLAPDVPQFKTVNHLTGQEESSKRRVLEESARIARGHVQDIAKVHARDFDAVVIPGGFGAALNLCDFATKGEHMRVHADVERFLLAMHKAAKPIGAMCIAPVVLAKLFGSDGAHITIGNDRQVADKLERMGSKHVDCAVDDIVVDERLKLVTTPAYMLAESVRDIHAGIRKLVDTVCRMTA